MMIGVSDVKIPQEQLLLLSIVRPSSVSIQLLSSCHLLKLVGFDRNQYSNKS